MTSITKDMALRLLAFLFPPACLACQRVEGVTSLPLCLCSRCSRKLDRLRQAPNTDGLGAGSALTRVLSRWSYEPPLDAVILALKFRQLEFLGQQLADGLHSVLMEAQVQEIDVVVPIPLHWHRRVARGYNQAEAIARPLARRLGLPQVRALRRHRWTRPQALLGRGQRRANLRRAFALRAHHADRIEGQRVLLVDDVLTTGSTLENAARCLRQGGAGSVIALTAGRTPAAPDAAKRKPGRESDRCL